MPVLSLKTVNRYRPLAKRLGVSKVARSSRGFLAAYSRSGGKLSRMSEKWKRKRLAFIKRHYAQVKKRREPLYKKGAPSRRHLALIMWAWSPKRLS